MSGTHNPHSHYPIWSEVLATLPSLLSHPYHPPPAYHLERNLTRIEAPLPLRYQGQRKASFLQSKVRQVSRLRIRHRSCSHLRSWLRRRGTSRLMVKTSSLRKRLG